MIFKRANNLFVSTALSTTKSTGLSGRKGVGGWGVRNYAALLSSAKFCEIKSCSFNQCNVADYN